MLEGIAFARGPMPEGRRDSVDRPDSAGARGETPAEIAATPKSVSGKRAELV